MQGVQSLANYNYTPYIQKSQTQKTVFSNNDLQTTDTFEKDNKKLSTAAKVGLSVAGLGLAALGTVYGVKKYNVKNIKNIQKAFQETFMRDDITVEQAREMMKRYKAIEKIKDRDEYAKALFAEAKKNFGMENSNIKLIFEPCSSMPNAAGFCKRDNSAISITPKCPRKEMLDTMHHEFRHAKQNDYLGTPERLSKYAEEYIDKAGAELMGLTPEEFSAKIMNDFYKSHENNVPKHLKEWYDKCRQGASNYTLENYGEYWNNFTEKDARKAGSTIEKYVRSKAFMMKSWFTETLSKIFFQNKNV